MKKCLFSTEKKQLAGNTVMIDFNKIFHKVSHSVLINQKVRRRPDKLTLWNVYILVHLEYCIESCTPPFKMDINKLNT